MAEEALPIDEIPAEYEKAGRLHGQGQRARYKQCPECEKKISDKAVKCPGCGYPLNVKQDERNILSDKKDKIKLVKGLNVALGTIGILMLIGVLSSQGGINGNKNATIVSWGILVAVIIGLLAIKLRNKVLAFCMVVPYAIALMVCLDSIKISQNFRGDS